jgi:hypothetical protein
VHLIFGAGSKTRTGIYIFEETDQESGSHFHFQVRKLKPEQELRF